MGWPDSARTTSTDAQDYNSNAFVQFGESTVTREMEPLVRYYSLCLFILL